jgi:hypothetical protein
MSTSSLTPAQVDLIDSLIFESYYESDPAVYGHTLSDFGALITETFSFYVRQSDKSVKHSAWTYQSYGFKNQQDFEYALLFIRICMKYYAADAKIRSQFNPDAKYLWQRGLAYEIDRDSNLGMCLKVMEEDFQGASVFRLALLLLDTAYNFSIGFYEEGTVWDTWIKPNPIFFAWVMNKTQDNISKEINRTVSDYLTAKKNAAETRDAVIKTGDMVEAALDAIPGADLIKSGLAGLQFGIMGTVICAVGTLPLGLAIGFRQSDKTTKKVAVGLAAMPAAYAGYYTYNNRAPADIKAKYGGIGAFVGLSLGLLVGRMASNEKVQKLAVSAASRGMVQI